MIVLNDTDVLEAWSGTNNVIDCDISGIVDSTLTRLYTGTLGNVANVVVYTAIGQVGIISIKFTNTDAAAATINLKVDPLDGGNDKFLLKSISLETGYTFVFDGNRFSLTNTFGMIVTTGAVSDLAYGVGWNGVTDIAASKNAIYDQMELKAPKASPTFTGIVTAPTIDLTGGQIAFPAAAVPSADPNTLDDYEEGTWTMGFAFGGAAVGIVYVIRTGYYMKIGGMVTVSGFLLISNKGSSNGNATITGLPFTVFNAQGAIAATATNLIKISFANQYSSRTPNNTTTIELFEATEAGVETTLTDANFANDSVAFLGVNYRATT